MGYLSDIARQVGLIDVLDIALVSGVIYVILSWLRGSIPESATRRILVAAPVVAGIYILVRAFDLYLLDTVVRVLFIVLLIVAVVVFQSDIRRMFDRAITSRFGDKMAEETSVVDTLAEAVSKMAEMRVGALIAIKGREPLDSHIHGGIELDGVVSQPLLFGIFDPDTPGHDGAVLVTKDRVTRFAVHLPLSSDVPEVSRFGGTRHAAALGLAEESDALVIVVSEERGTIAVAHDGHLTPEVDVSDLKGRLEGFWDRHYQPNEPARQVWWRRRSLQTAMFAVMLSFLFWLLVVYSPNTVIRTLSVPIEIRNLPQDWSLEGDLPAEAEVVLSGSEQVFQRLDASNLAISIDASQPDEGALEIVIAESDINLPAGIDLTRVDPQVLRVNMRRLRPVRVPVKVRTTGRLPARLELAGLESVPDSVTILVPGDENRSAKSVGTQAIDLGEVQGDAEVTRRIVLPDDTSLPSGASKEVVVRVDTREREEREEGEERVDGLKG